MVSSEVPLPSILPAPTRPRLTRELTLIDAVSVIIGVIIGSGIFATPGLVLGQAGSVGEALIVWIAAGVIMLCPALLYSELSSSLPVVSGDAEYYRKAFGPAWSFAFVWTAFLVLLPGGITVVCSTIAHYFVAAFFFEDSDSVDKGWFKLIAISILVIFTLNNCFGVKVGSIVQNVLTIWKFVLVLVILVVAGVFLTKDVTVIQSNFSKPFHGSSLFGFGPSLLFALWAFAGVNNIGYLTEELKNPSRDASRACFWSMAIVTCTYVLVNLSYLSVVPAARMSASVTIAVDSAVAAMGQRAGTVVGILVGVSLLGSCNAKILCGSRYLFGAARDGHIPGKWLTKLSETSGAPVLALATQSAWCALLLLVSSDLAELLNYFSVAVFIMMITAALAHWTLRRKYPDLPRPFMTPFFPFVNIIVICVYLYMIISSVAANPLPTLMSLSLVLLSFPVYHVFIKTRNVESESAIDSESAIEVGNPLLNAIES